MHSRGDDGLGKVQTWWFLTFPLNILYQEMKEKEQSTAMKKESKATCLRAGFFWTDSHRNFHSYKHKNNHSLEKLFFWWHNRTHINCRTWWEKANQIQMPRPIPKKQRSSSLPVDPIFISSTVNKPRFMSTNGTGTAQNAACTDIPVWHPSYAAGYSMDNSGAPRAPTASLRTLFGQLSYARGWRIAKEN